MLKSEWGHLNFLFDLGFKPCPQNLHRGEGIRAPELVEQLGHLSRGGSRSGGMPHECYGDPVTNDIPEFHSNIPVTSSQSLSLEPTNGSGRIQVEMKSDILDIHLLVSFQFLPHRMEVD